MRRIPDKTRRELAADPAMKKCIFSVWESSCSSRIVWHHPYIYRNRRILDFWATVPVCKRHHDVIHKERLKIFVDHAKAWALYRASPGDLESYPKFDWNREMRRLNIIK
jgi:hypothetical protein